MAAACMPKSRILAVDDDSQIRESLRMTLEYNGYEFVPASTGQEGLALAEREAPDVDQHQVRTVRVEYR